jgi:RNA polymerase sigma-70 factor (ECF subfamily)
MVKKDDAALVEESLLGKTKSFEVLVDKYQKTIFNVAFRLCNDYDDATDITQTAFIKAYENLKNYNPRYKFFSWIYRIVINETLNFLSQKKRLQNLEEDIIEKSNSPDKIYDQSELQIQIQEALMTLDPNYRILIILKHFQNISYNEISNLLDIPEKTVKSRLYTARQQFGKILIGKGIGINE